MSDAPLEAIEDELERAGKLADPEALEVLRSAKRDLETVRRERDDVDREVLEPLEDRLNQRIREVGERDAYDSGMGAAMEPDEEDAP